MDLPILAALIGAGVGVVSATVTSFIAIRKLSIELEQIKATTAATWTEAQAVVISSLRDENKELRLQIKSLQRQDREQVNQIQALQARTQELEAQNRALKQENAELRKFYEQANEL